MGRTCGYDEGRKNFFPSLDVTIKRKESGWQAKTPMDGKSFGAQDIRVLDFERIYTKQATYRI